MKTLEQIAEETADSFYNAEPDPRITLADTRKLRTIILTALQQREQEHAAKVASLTKRNQFLEDFTPKTNLGLIEQIGVLTKERDEAREDVSRLDWLEKTQTSVGYNVENSSWGVDFEAPYEKTARAAITQAMTGGAE